MVTRYAGPKHGFVSSPVRKDYLAENRELRARSQGEGESNG